MEPRSRFAGLKDDFQPSATTDVLVWPDRTPPVSIRSCGSARLRAPHQPADGEDGRGCELASRREGRAGRRRPDRAASRSGVSACARREADRLLAAVLVAGAVPHLFKLLFRRRRPDRSVRPHGKGIPRSGNAWDSFPSGHAVHLGAIAPSLARLAPERLGFAVWQILAALASTRIVLLAHYPTDVLAGWGIGLAVNKAACALLPNGSRRPGAQATCR
jgi:hypothetical protein